MPRNQRPRKRRRRAITDGRRRRRARRGYRLSKRLPALTGFPNKKLVRLRYVDKISLDATPLLLDHHFFRANSLFAPNATGGTGAHQPLGFDQWMTIYDHFYVIGSKIRVTPMNTTTDILQPGAFGVTLDDNQTLGYTKTEQILESKQGKSGVKISGSTADGKTRSATRTFSHRKFFGSKHLIGQEQFKGSNSSDPSEGAFFCVWYGNMAGNDPASLPLMVEIEYIALMVEPRFIAQS